jgi:hypothetical protein
MAPPNGEIEAMRRVVRELRSEEAPELDWERIEGELFEKLEREKAVPIVAARPRSRLFAGIAAAAAIAAGSFGVYRLASAPEPPLAAPAPRPVPAPELRPSVVDGNRLAAGAGVRTDQDEVRVEHAGGTWTLEPQGSAVLVRTADPLVIRLDSGAILAHVVPAKTVESFVIEVGKMRVAVHGTVFRVERRGAEALVEVSEGAVAVGATTDEAARGWLLRAPARGKFTLDGKSGTVEDLRGARVPLRTRPGSRILPEIAPTLAPEASVSSPEPPPPSVSAELVPAAPAELPSKPSIVELEDGISRLIDAVNGCFAQHTHTGGDMRITAKSSVTLLIAPDGRITSQRFAPPLAPTVQRCSSLKLAELRFAPSKEGITVTRNIEFGR